MHTKHTHIPARAKSILSAWTVACLIMSLLRGPLALIPSTEAASTFRPTIFVSTEAFLAIDDDDTTADVVLRFGDTLAKTLTFNRSLDRFEFNDDVYVTGTIQASSTLSGAIVHAQSQLRASGSLVVDGTTIVNNNTINIYRNASPALSLSADGTSANVQSFSQPLALNPSGNNVGIGKINPRTKLDVVGAISGSFIYATQSFSGAGLSDCDGGTSKLLWDATTGRFSCGTITSTSYTAGQGLNLNGANAFALNATITGSLVEFTTVSGSTVYAEKQLSVSGSTILGEDDGDSLLVYGYSTFVADAEFQKNVSIGDSDTRSLLVASNVTFNTTDGPNAFFNVRGDNDPNLFYVNPATDRIGIGMSDPDTRLEVAGTISGTSLVANDSIFGAGLTDCDTGATSKLLWDAATGRFTCGTDQTGSSSYTAGQGLSLDGDVFSLSASISGTLLEFQTVSGAKVFSQDLLASSGGLTVENNSGENVAVFSNSVSSVARLRLFNSTTGETNTDGFEIRNGLNYNEAYLMNNEDEALHLGTNGMDRLTIDRTGNVSIGKPDPKTRLDVVGTISGSFIYAAQSFSGAGLTDCDASGQKLLWDAMTGQFSCGSDDFGMGYFNISDGTVTESVSSGDSVLFQDGTGIDVTVSATDTVTIASNNVYANDMDQNVGTNDGVSFHTLAVTSQTTLNDSVYFGDDISDTMYVTSGIWNFANITTFNLNGGPLMVKGVLSGVTLYATQSFSGAGLTDCDTGATSKLLWDATTGRFSCGTDQTGGGGSNWSNTGSLQLAFDSRYVNVAGDTMTGGLTIQNGNAHTPTTTPLLNIRGTMSGRQLNISGSGASPLLTTTAEKQTVRIGGSGSLVIEARATDPGSAPANTATLFAQKVGGRAMLHQGSGSTFAASPLQNALFGNLIMSITTGAGTTVNGYGTTVTNDTTVSHPAAGQTFGYMTNFATSTTANDEAGTSSANVAFFRGNADGANGFFYYARVGVVDTTSITVFSGMADQTIATMVGADNPAGNHVGFQFSTGRGDTNWMFTTKDNTTQNANSTGLAFTANKVYDLMFTCTKQCTSITWEIRNVTDGTSAKGSTSTNLPAAGTALRMVLGVETETTAARNIRMQQLYVEADR